MIKRVILNDYLLPDAVIVDPLMTANLPPRITADTGIDALTHAIEGYTHARANVVSDMFAETAIKLVSSNRYRWWPHFDSRYGLLLTSEGTLYPRSILRHSVVPCDGV